MGLYALEGRTPVVDSGTFISSAAHVIGDVQIATGCWIGPGAVIRADFGTIKIGSFTAIEENCIIHCLPDCSCTLGDHVTVGHGAILHGTRIEDYVSIGMGAVVGVGAVLRRWCIVGEGTVIKSGQEIPAESIVVGVPARVVGQLDEKRKEFWEKGKALYEQLVSRYLKGLKPL